jgi:hypothetical protein
LYCHLTHGINRGTGRDSSRHCAQEYPIGLATL